MESQLDKIIECPICLETMHTPIILCKMGHSMDGDCVRANTLDFCPVCKGPLSDGPARNYQLEQTIESMPKDLMTPCFNAANGCKEILSSSNRRQHEAECKHRRFTCEGKTYAHWNCEWTGLYADLENHFESAHHSVFQFKTAVSLKIDLTKDSKDVKIIPFYNGAHYFWYKHKVDTAKKMVYWTFQYVGPKKDAKKFFFEFEISQGPTRKIKVTEICDSDGSDADRLFEDKQNCVAVFFQTVKSFLNEKGVLPILFRVMEIKQDRGHGKDAGVLSKSPPDSNSRVFHRTTSRDGATAPSAPRGGRDVYHGNGRRGPTRNIWLD